MLPLELREPSSRLPGSLRAPDSCAGLTATGNQQSAQTDHGVSGAAVGATVVGASVVGASVVGASVVGASVVGASVVGASVVGASVVGA
ncbi:hypothetical protein, partial [uncultured Ilumatobacter sp.]|uniref:hypothetical protein n=1 Tax=uncultured Ilumatobacter sp. TaxID=879968 RepID=UPI00374F6269